MGTRRAVAWLLLLLSDALPGAAGDEFTPDQMAAWRKACDDWAAGGDRAFGPVPHIWDGMGDPDRAELETMAGDLDPLPPGAVAPLAEHLFSLAGKDWPPLETGRGPHWLLDPKDERGAYRIERGKDGAPLLVVLGEKDGRPDPAARALAAWKGAAPADWNVIATEVGLERDVPWNAWSEEIFLQNLLAAARRALRFDTDRVYLVGQGTGGRAAWVSVTLLGPLGPSVPQGS